MRGTNLCVGYTLFDHFGNAQITDLRGSSQGTSKLVTGMQVTMSC